ncbi:MAG TPA: pantetheine-phosphate adenylyltransferase [Candidatus Omnitrophica bacterium]|nr:pantetheine-phosphate adenylyltransferase [Candidatus Omnitrophota bacterium]
MCQRAIYPGTFDPVTYGHVDVIKRALKVFPELVVAVADSPIKGPLFSVSQRVKMLKIATKDFGDIPIEPFSGLVVDFARANNASVIVRGLRMLSDFEYEFQMALTNRKIAPDLETMFLMPSENYSYISSKLLKEAASLGANLSSFLPPDVERNLKKHLKK